MSLAQIFMRLTQRLYPQGRAHKLPPPDGSPPDGGELYRLHRVINLSFARAYTAATDTFKAIFPDDDGFTIDDAHAWYKRLGIYDSYLVPLADMKLAIARKLSFPLVPLNKQSPEYIQEQLQAAGFDVYVYKNKFFDSSPPGNYTRTPGDILGFNYGYGIYGLPQYGQTNYGGLPYIVTKCVNYIEESKDAYFNPGTNLKSTFFIAGDTIDTYATVDINRKIEFRQLILQLKSAEMCAFLFVNYA